MSLATRCHACGTVFRVVQDQLKVSEGWVRCGRCNEVFNALEALFDLERDTPPEWVPPGPAAVSAAPAASAAPTVDVNVGHDGGVDLIVGERADEPAPPIYRRQTDSTPAMRIDERDRLDFPDARFESEPAPAPAEADDQGEVSILLPLGEDDVVPAPEFVRHAQRRARWQSPWARAGLGVAGTLLALGLALQAAHHFRDTLAAQWPATRPALLAWCGVAGCSIQPPRHIEDIAVESTALTRADDSADRFRLAVTLRNRASTALAIPAVDLSLTDPSGVLVARRMLTPSDFRVGVAAIAPGAELPLQLVLSTGNARVTGYTVEIFYP